VKRGETISEIADEYGISQRELLDWNGLDQRGRIRAGQRIRVSAPEVRTVPQFQPQPTPGVKRHVVRRGETLKGLARRYGVSIQALREANGISEQEPLRAGVSLKIPG
jgi:LysM repeat protein